MKKWILILFIAMAGAVGQFASATSKETTPSNNPMPMEVDTQSIETTEVVLDGRPLFCVRGMAGFSSEKRAKMISDRIRSVAADRSIPAEEITLNPTEGRAELLARDVILATILEADAATEKIPLNIMAESARRNVVRAIDDYRHDRSAKVLMRRSLVAAAATAAFFFLLLALGRVYRLVLAATERGVKTRMESLEKRSSNVIESRPLWTAILGVLSALKFIAAATLTYFYLNLVLGLYPWTRPLAVQLFSIFIAPIRKLGGNFFDALPDIAFLVIFSIIIRYILKITQLFFTGIAQGTFTIENLESDLAMPTYRIVRFLIVCFAIVVAYPYIPGSNSDAFKGVSLFIGVLFSLGSTSLIGNLIASIALTYRRAFKVGDIIKVNDVMGLVTEMRVQATHLRTLHNEMIVIPNTIVVNSHVTNFSSLARKEGLVLHTTVGVGYQTPWRQVEAMLFMAAERTTGLKSDSKSFVRQLALDTFYVRYELSVYCDAPLEMPWIYTNLHKNILDVFNEYGVQIMTPAYEGDPENPKIVPKDQVHAALADKLNV